MDGKKISFGFSKLKKASQLVKPVVVEKQQIQYVDEFNGEEGKFSFQGAGVDAEPKKELVIPLIGTRSAYDVIKSKLDKKENAELVIKTEPAESIETAVSIKSEPLDSFTSSDGTAIEQQDVKPNLEELAANEILKDLNNKCEESKDSGQGRVIAPDVDKLTFEGEKESTLEDYENVPVGDYGLALLRGMGWTPQTGIGKDSKIVAPVASKLRPKRLGLGAECAPPPGEGVQLKKGSYIQVVAGHLKDAVGVVESLDGDTACVFVKIHGRGNISLSENVIKIITPKQYDDLIKNPGTGNGVPRTENKQYGIIEKVKSEKDEIRKPQSENKLNQEWQKRIKDKGTRDDSSRHRKKRERESKEDRRRRDKSSSGSIERYRERSSSPSSSKKHKSHREARKEKRRKEKDIDDRKKRNKSSSSDDERPRKRDRYRSDSDIDEDRSREKKKKKRSRSRERSKKSRRSSSTEDRSSKQKKKKYYSSDSDDNRRRRR